jgi:hypothetical protein
MDAALPAALVGGNEEQVPKVKLPIRVIVMLLPPGSLPYLTEYCHIEKILPCGATRLIAFEKR